MVLDAEFAGTHREALAVDLALIPDEMGVRGPQNDIHRIGTALQDQGIAWIMTSMPLLGERKPKVRCLAFR